jgi:hypothetical protein
MPTKKRIMMLGKWNTNINIVQTAIWMLAAIQGPTRRDVFSAAPQAGQLVTDGSAMS